MASAALSRRVEKVVGYPPLSEIGADQRREFHEALLEAGAFEDLPGKWQAAIVTAEQNGPHLRVVCERLTSLPRFRPERQSRIAQARNCPTLVFTLAAMDRSITRTTACSARSQPGRSGCGRSRSAPSCDVPHVQLVNAERDRAPDERDQERLRDFPGGPHDLAFHARRSATVALRIFSEPDLACSRNRRWRSSR
jgi:hypothetical protein